jgi:AraC family ethanolamine operon transcriptional activator
VSFAKIGRLLAVSSASGKCLAINGQSVYRISAIMKVRQNKVRVPQANVTVVEIRDPTTAGEDIEVIEQNLVQLRSEPLRAIRIVVRLETTVLIYHSTNLAVRTRAMFKPGLTGVVAFGPRARGTVEGLVIHPHLMLMAVERTECQFVVEGGYESIAVGIPPKDLEVHLRARQQWGRLQPHRNMELLLCDATKADAFFAFGKRMADTAARQPDLFDGKKQVCAAAAAELVETLLGAMGSSEEYEVTRSDKTHQSYSHIVRLAEECALSQTDGPLYVANLCKAAGVSERTLEYAFREILDMSPVAFLRRLRLHRVRHALREGTRGTTTVSAEALKWGFWHFGDFSQAYKNCFRESPSDTLRRGPDHS